MGTGITRPSTYKTTEAVSESDDNRTQEFLTERQLLEAAVVRLDAIVKILNEAFETCIELED
jgi:hypothetical protein